MKDTQSNIELKPQPGRPSKYRPSWCEEILDMGNRGMGYAQIARELKISRSMLYRFRDAHPDFAAALAWARDLSVAHWTDKLTAAGSDRNSNAQLLMFVSSNLFPDDFKLKRDVAVTGDPSAPLTVKAVRSISREELEKMATQYLEERDASEQGLLTEATNNPE